MKKKLLILALLPFITSASISLAAVLDAEFRLPVYLNRSEATLVLERNSDKAPVLVEISFTEQNTGQAPVPPTVVQLKESLGRHEHTVDISAWPDGQYRALIRNAGDSRDVGLVRGFIKQTLSNTASPPIPCDMRNTRMLFVDDWLIDQSSKLTRRICPPEMIPVTPWIKQKDLARYPRNRISSFFVDKDGSMNARITTSTVARGKNTQYWAKSNDLKNWEVIKTPKEQHPDCIRTNLSTQSMNAPTLKKGAVCRPYAPATDGTPDITQVRVYFTGTKHGEIDWAGYKTRGRRVISVWEKAPGLRLILKDSITELPTEKSGLPPEGEIGDWTRTNDNFGRPTLSADGKTLRFQQTLRIPRNAPFRTYYDNILSDRILATWSSQDGIQWTHALFNPPSPEDPPCSQHYDMHSWKEEDGRLELAYYQVYDARLQKITTELASSRDGIYWQRVEPRVPFLSNGENGEWNFGFSRPTGHRYRVEFEDYYYETMQGINVPHFMFLISVYRTDRSGIDSELYKTRFDGRLAGKHGLQHSPIWDWYGSWEKIAKVTREEFSTPGLIRYRKDRWAALTATTEEGSLITKPLTAAKQTLAINANTGDKGKILVEVLDANGNPLPGYSGEDAAVFTGDSTGATLRWAKGTKAHLPDTPFRLSLRLENAELYALEFSQSKKD